MKHAVRFFAAALVVAGAAARLSAEKGPWWMTDTYAATDAKIESIPVSDIDRTWTQASLLTPAKMSPEARAYFKEFTNEPSVRAASFDVKGDFNRDGRPDRGVVGVYRTKSGEDGRFVLILTQAGNAWTTAFVDTIPGGPGFSILMPDDDRLLWSTCFECDTVSEISWEKDHYETDESDDPDDQEE